MDLERKVAILSEIGEFFKFCFENGSGGQFENESIRKLAEEYQEIRIGAQHQNGWFIPTEIDKALSAWANSLEHQKINQWLQPYDLKNEGKKCGIIMAGNIPFVGLHDALSVLITGNVLHAKLSSKDQLLMAWALKVLATFNPDWKDNIKLVQQLKDIDYLIATGSDNASRYFEYYFKDVKKLIRKNRTSVAIINGQENDEELDGLADDVFTHFGLGCRNVTKVFIPQSYDLDKLFKAFFKYQEIANHNKYGNNYDYNKAVYLLNKIDLIENGFLLMKEDEALHSPVAVLFYSYYQELSEVEQKLALEADKIQCIVSTMDNQNHLAFGKAQCPELWDYADGVDTLQFLGASIKD